jgi:hypothetical protein|tara:strand:+ start:224 stop:505 length:282 start_codon:yes stop_codon:yes gene_type:complete
MTKRELKLSDKRLYEDTKEDIILSSPSRIPDKGIQNILSLKNIHSMDVADYDIAPTEIQLMRVGDVFTLNTWKGHLLKPGEGEMLMGQEDNNT